MFTIEDAKQVQADLGLRDVHVAYFNPAAGFVLAHTDAERALQALSPLAECDIHQWLGQGYRDLVCCLPEAGWYEIASVHGARGLPL
jgi:hypothetical protein